MSAELFAPHGPAPLRFSVTLALHDAEPGVQWAAEGGRQQDHGADGPAQPATAGAMTDPRSPAPVRRPASQSFAAPQLHFCVGPSSLRTPMGGGHSGSGSGSGSGCDSGAVSLTGALERCFLETGLGAAERALVTRLAVLARMQVAEEQLQQQYSAALLKQLQQQPQGGDDGTGAATAQPAVPTRHTQRTGQSDGIGHWDHEEEEEGEEEVPVVQWADPNSGEDVAAPGQPQSEPQLKQPKLQQQAQRSVGALAAWRRVRFTPPPARSPSGAVVPARRRPSAVASAQPSLGALISALLVASCTNSSESGGSGGSDAHGGLAAQMSLGSDSPLSRLYQLASLYHAEHLVYLAKKQASYAALQAAQSREMDVVCAQAQQSEIDDAALGYDDDRSDRDRDRDRDRDGKRRGSNTSDADGSALDRELLGSAEGDDSHSAAAAAAASSTDGNTDGRADADSDRTPSPSSSLSGPSVSGSSLSEAISLLVQSHLVQSSVLEEEWESRLDSWCAVQRRKFAVFLRDTAEEFLDRQARSAHARQAHEREQAAAAAEVRAKRHRKILMSDAEEAEEAAREAREALARRGPHPAALVRLYECQEEGRMDEEVLAALPTELLLPSWNPALPGTAPATSSAAASAAAGQAQAQGQGQASAVTGLVGDDGSQVLDGSGSGSGGASVYPSGPPAAAAPFPLRSLLHARSVYLGPPGRSTLMHLFLTNDPLFVPNSQRGAGSAAAAATMAPSAAAAAAATSPLSNGAGPAAPSAPVAVSSSPLISLHHYVSTLDALHGPRGAGGLSAMVLPHHSSPLLHAAHSHAPAALLPTAAAQGALATAGGDDAAASAAAAAAAAAALDSLDSSHLESVQAQLSASSPAYFAASRRARERALNAFSAANLYVKNLLQYVRAQNDLLCDEFSVQVQRIEAQLVRMRGGGGADPAAPDATAALSPFVADASSGSSAGADAGAGAVDAEEEEEEGGLSLTAGPDSVAALAAAPPAPLPDTSSLLSHGDVLLTKHSHMLNAHLCFHVNVHPRRGGAGAASASAATVTADLDFDGAVSAGGSVSGVVMNEAELKQQSTLFSVLSHVISLSSRYNVRTLSLPLIWDNILLSMWSTSGSYVGFGWKDADAYGAHMQSHAAGGAGGGGGDGDSGAGGSGGADGAAAAARSEELEVYQCMVRYLESHMRAIKQCLCALDADAPLRNVVFYLPASLAHAGHGASGLLDLDAAATHAGALLDDNININGAGADSGIGGVVTGGSGHVLGASLHTLGASSSGSGSSSQANQHPFLAKCKMIFAEVFQS